MWLSLGTLETAVSTKCSCQIANWAWVLWSYCTCVMPTAPIPSPFLSPVQSATFDFKHYLQLRTTVLKRSTVAIQIFLNTEISDEKSLLQAPPPLPLRWGWWPAETGHSQWWCPTCGMLSPETVAWQLLHHFFLCQGKTFIFPLAVLILLSVVCFFI